MFARIIRSIVKEKIEFGFSVVVGEIFSEFGSFEIKFIISEDNDFVQTIGSKEEGARVYIPFHMIQA